MKKVGVNAATYLTLVAGAIFALFPFFWMLSTSFKGEDEVFSLPIHWLPTVWHLKNYIDALNALPFGQYFLNSLIVTIGIIVLQLLTSIFAAYAFARLHFRGRNILFLVLLMALMVPQQTILIPLVKMLSNLGWLNTYQGLILPFGWSALITYLFRQFLLNFPSDIEDAARIDGCGTLRLIFQFVIPLSKPIIATAFILVFMYAWNQYLWPLVISTKQSMFTLQLGLSQFKQADASETNWPLLMTASTIVMLPMIIVFSVFQKHIIESLTYTGTKE